MPKTLVQPMYGIANQVPQRGAMNVSSTSHSEAGLIAAALEVAPQLFRSGKSADTAADAIVETLESFTVDRLTEQVLAEANASPKLTDLKQAKTATTDACAMQTKLASKTSSAEQRELIELARTTVGNVATKLRSQFTACCARNQAGAREALNQAAEKLAGISAEPFDPAPLKRLTMLAQKQVEIKNEAEEFTPRALEIALDRLSDEAVQANSESLVRVVRHLTSAALLGSATKLQAEVSDFQRSLTTCQRQAAEVRQHLAKTQQSALEQQAQQQASVTVLLPGISKDGVLAKLCKKLNCADSEAAVDRLRELFEQRMRDRAAELAPNQHVEEAGFSRLIEILSPPEMADLILQLLRDQAGESRSVYERFRDSEVKTIVHKLWAKAAPTCSFGGRENFRFGLSLYELSIVQLPVSSNAREEQVRMQLLDEFRAVEPSCEITSASAGEEIAVTRIVAGWVIGIEEANRALLDRYVAAGRNNHPPHLLGVVDDSRLGKISEAHASLLNQ